jgi:hypothetical protein
MRLKKEEEEILEKIIDEFCKEHGREALKATYQLYNRLRKELGLRYFPIQNIFHYLLFHDLKNKYKNITLKKIAEIEAISGRSIYNFYNHYVKRKQREKLSLPIKLPK